MPRIHASVMVAVLLASPILAAKNDMYHVFMGGNPQEMQLARQVRRSLLTLAGYGIFDDLEFSMNGITVTLSGEVRKPSLQQAADYAVHRIKGITLVTDKIQVLPPSATDERLRYAVYDAIFAEPPLEIRYGYRALPPIHIVVKDGRVRLEGVVDNEADRDRIAECAKSVTGVKSVTNNLLIES